MSTLQPVEAPLSLANQAFERVLSAIITGEIPPGEYIKEARVARLLNISRGPLREAIGKLEGYKLLERTPNMGARVITFTPNDIEELFSLREALEGLCCQLAATAMTDAELDNLERLLEEENTSSTELGYYADDEDFHFQIIRGSRNSRLISLLSKDIYYQLRMIRHRSGMDRARKSAVHNEHVTILKALRARDPKRAEAAMRKHISNARQTASALFEDPAQATATPPSRDGGLGS